MNKSCAAFLTYFILVSFALAADRVLIFTYSYNRPDFIEIQHRSFKKFLKDEYEFIVFNDARYPVEYAQIRDMCDKLGILCIDIPQEIHGRPYLPRWPGEDLNHPSVRNSNVVQYSLDNVGFYHDGIVALFDSDLFLVREFSIADFLKDHHLAGVPQSKSNLNKQVNYIWIGLAFLNMSTMPNRSSINFNCGQVDGVGVDAGGQTAHYLRDNLGLKVKNIGLLSSPFFPCPDCTQKSDAICTHNTEDLQREGFDNYQIAFIQSGPQNCEFLGGNCFLHYRGGTNWNYLSPEYHAHKTKIFHEYFHRILGN